MEWQERDKVAAEWQKKRDADATEQDQQVIADGMNRIFIGRLSSYKKGDLRALAVALVLSDKGTNAELVSRIKDHLDQHPELRSNQRFSGMFPKQIQPTQDTNALIDPALLATTYGKHLMWSFQWICAE